MTRTMLLVIIAAFVILGGVVILAQNTGTTYGPADTGTRVEAPGTRIESDNDKTRIQAPGVDGGR